MPSSSRGSSPVDVPEYSTQFEPGPDDSETLWNVLEIIKEDKKRYLVIWEGVDPDTGKPWEPSWVPKRDCTDDLIFEWKVTKAKKDKARKKRRKSKGEMDAYDPKRPTKSYKVGKSKSNARPLAPSRKLSSTAGPSRLPSDASSGKVSPVLELVRHKKRRRESFLSDDESAGFVTEGAPQLKKQRKRVADQRIIISHSPASQDKAKSPFKLGQSLSRSISPQDHDGLDAIHLNGTSQGHSRSPGRQGDGSPHTKKHRSRTSREKKHHKHESKPRISSSPQRALIQYDFESGYAREISKRPVVPSSHSSGTGDFYRGYDEGGVPDDEPVQRKSMGNDRLSDRLHSLKHNDVEGISISVDDGEGQLDLDDIVPQDHDVDKSDHWSRSPSPPSPRDLILGSGKGMDTVIAETQSSVLASQPMVQAPPSKVPLPQKDAKLVGFKRHMKNSESRTDVRANKARALGPVRNISPAEFESYVSQARSTPPESQISSIETFSLDKSQATIKRGAKGQERILVDPRLQDTSASQRQGQDAGSDDKRDSVLRDPIEDYETPPSDQALELRGARLAEAARQQRSLFALSKPAQRPLNDIISSSISSNLNGVESQRDGEFDMGGNDVVSETESHQDNQGLKNGVRGIGSHSSAEFATRHQRASSKEVGSSLGGDGSAFLSDDADGEDQRELDRDETDELGPEDALDAREPPRPSVPTNIFSSAEVNYSLEANAALTQQSAFRIPVIASPVRELNHALGLLNRKSEEIELLKVALKNHQSRIADLDGELVHLKRNLELAEERYNEVTVALNKEKAAKVSQEEQVEESTVKNMTTSSVEYADSFIELHRENEELKLTRSQLESDTDMLRRLYAQASDAHQSRVAEIKALERDNNSLREQATTGIKQAHLFWTTQVHTLEKELTLSKGAIELLTDQARRTDNDIRTRAALLPMAQQNNEAAKQEIENWKAKFMELGRENTRLRLEVKGWEDEAMTRRMREQEIKERESASQDELVWMCSWMDNKHGAKCGALLESREKLREHIYEAGHI